MGHFSSYVTYFPLIFVQHSSAQFHHLRLHALYLWVELIFRLIILYITINDFIKSNYNIEPVMWCAPMNDNGELGKQDERGQGELLMVQDIVWLRVAALIEIVCQHNFT